MNQIFFFKEEDEKKVFYFYDERNPDYYTQLSSH